MKARREPKRIPSREECLRLMTESRMLQNIVEHSVEVARVALFLSRALNGKGQTINLELVEAASLLHDLTKTECLVTKEDHAKTGCVLLNAMGYERVAEVVGDHIVLSRTIPPLGVSEEEVVNYADKRVQHDKIVSLDERFRDLMERYGKGNRVSSQWKRLMEATFEVEAKIFSILGADPDDLEHLSRECDV